MAGQPTQGTLTLDGAELYYETRGTGLPVLIVQGGLSEAGATEQLANDLADDHQVITYDRRGLSRSRASVDAPATTLEQHADDAAALLAAVSTTRAGVVGSSIGALIGLHLAVRHPERVATLVAHEPPMSSLVTDPDQEAALDRIAALARKDQRAAIQQMAALTGAGDATRESGARPGASVGDLDTNLGRFFLAEFHAVRRDDLSTARIAAALTTTIPTGGVESRGRWEYRCAQRLAESLGREIVELPGGHGGLITHPWATAAALRGLFAGIRHAV